MKLLKICVLCSIAMLILIEVYQITKLTFILEKAITTNNNSTKNSQTYILCINKCIRETLAKIDKIDEYNKCINKCEFYYKKIDNLNYFTYKSI